MGWSWNILESSRKDEITDHTRTESHTYPDTSITTTRTCLAHCYRGASFKGNLWAVWERTWSDGRPSERYITLHLMQCINKCWGYKDMDESCGPYEVSCPLKYLEMVPDPGWKFDFPDELPWRDRVRAYHAHQTAKRRYKRTIGPLFDVPEAIRFACETVATAIKKKTDKFAWLVACDELEERGVDASAIRRIWTKTNRK